MVNMGTEARAKETEPEWKFVHVFNGQFKMDVILDKSQRQKIREGLTSNEFSRRALIMRKLDVCRLNFPDDLLLHEEPEEDTFRGLEGYFDELMHERHLEVLA